MRRRYAWISMLLVLGACSDTPSGPEDPRGPTSLGSVYRIWGIFKLTNDEKLTEVVDANDQTGGVVDISREIGSMVHPLPIAVPHPIAMAEVFSNETGKTYWVGAQSPSPYGLQAQDSAIGSEVQFRQAWKFRKDSPNATFQLVISDVFLEVYDGNGMTAQPGQCGWSWHAQGEELIYVCESLILAHISAKYWAYADTLCCPDPFFSAMGAPGISGWGSTFTPGVSTDSRVGQPLFDLDDFDIQPFAGQDRHVTMRLRSPITVDIPLDSVAVGEAFEVGTRVIAKAWSRRQGESYAGAYFRDPAKTNGLSLEFDGVTMLPPPAEVREPSLITSPALPCDATGTDGAGGTIQFDTTSYLWPEWPGDEAEITITRTGGGGGEASVAFATGGGTATPGSDYESVTTHVRFADGETGVRTVYLPITADHTEEPHETVSLTLSSPAGCATLGGQTSAELTILDDDQPLPAAYTVGGTVTGLAGTGLELRDGATSVVRITSDGSWAFPADYAAGATYDVTVGWQPDNPLQACTVANGQGTVGDEDVTDILVTCVTPSASNGLDPDFGTGGVVKAGITPYSDHRFATELALQGDGKILAVGTNTLVRYHADGTLDTGFGTGGQVRVAFGSGSELLHAVAVQPDGRILVAGTAVDPVNLPADDDFGLARFEADGSPDAGFGNGGVVVTDFNGRLDNARDILIQPDGAIVVVGAADAVDQFGSTDPDFALARYTSAGDPDPTFGAAGNGRATVNIGGRLNGGYAAALQSDGRIVVVGTVAASRGSDPDLGIARFDRNGVLDPTFGTGGIVWDDTPAEAEWALDVAVDANDRILVSGSRVSGGDADAFVARYNAGGDPDAGFGNGGVAVSTLLWGANGIALDAGGGIVIVGATPEDFGVVRLGTGGAPDTGFGDGGLVAIDFFGGFDEASDVVIQPDGRILVGGKIDDGLPVVGLARVLPVAGSRVLRAGRRP